MDPTQRHARALELARAIFRLEDQREALDRQIEAAKKEHLALMGQEPTPFPENSPASRVPKLADFLKSSATSARGEAPGTTISGSVRSRILKYVAEHAPVGQADVLQAVTAAGIDEKTAKQAIYDMTSVKVGWLSRAGGRLVLSDSGKGALG